MLEYFDAHIVGLTATPVKQTFGSFQQNLVAEYTYAQSVAENVDFDIYRIQTQITDQGSTVEAGTSVPFRDRRTRRERYEAVDDDLNYTWRRGGEIPPGYSPGPADLAASVGVAAASPGEPISNLFARADAALYCEKRARDPRTVTNGPRSPDRAHSSSIQVRATL